MDADSLRVQIDIDGALVDAGCYDEETVEDTNESTVLLPNEAKLEAAVSTNFTTMAIVLAVYWVLHCKEPKRYYRNPLKRGFGPPRPHKFGAWGWLPVVWRMPLDEVEKHVGSNGRAILEFISLVMRIMAFYAFFAVLSLGTYLSTGTIASSHDDWVDPGFLESASLLGSLEHAQNLDGSWHVASFYSSIWFSVLCSYVLTLLTLWMLRRSWVRMIDSQQQRMLDKDHVCLRTILVRTTAPKYATEAKRMWEDAYPGAIDSVRVVRDSRQLPQLLSRAFSLAKEIKGIEEDLDALRADVDLLEDTDGESGTKEAKAADARAKLDTRLTAAITEHEEASAAAEKELIAIDVPDNDRGVFSFVCFKTRSTAHFAQQVMTSVAVDKARPAPAEEDINWSALYPDAANRATAARLTVTASYYTMLCFYSVPIAFVSSLIHLETLQEQMPSLRVILCAMGETARSFIAAFLPQLALKVFMALLPTICLRMAWLRGSPNLARIEVDAILNVWLFNFVWLLFGAAAISGLVTDRSYDTLVLTMGDYSIFLMIYLNLQATVALPLALLARGPKIAMEVLAARLRRKAPETLAPEPLPYHSTWSMVFLSSAVGMVYAVAYPVVIPFVLHHLGTSYLLICRSLLFSNSKGWIAGKVDGGKAAIWPHASRWLLIVLLVGQAFVAGAHLASDQWVSSLFFIPLAALDFVADRQFNRYFKPRLKHLSIASCNQLDDNEKVLGEASRSKKLQELFAPGRTYVQPDMRTETWGRLREGKTAPARPGDPPPAAPRFRVAVIGASGGVGRHVVRLLLAQKHTVVALAREPADVVPRSDRRLKKFKVDLAHCGPPDLARLIKRCHFVISCLGNRQGEDKVLKRGTGTLIEAMQMAGVGRMAMLSCVGVRDSDAQLRKQGWQGWVYSMLFSSVLGEEMQDLAAAEVICQAPRRGPEVASVVVRASDLSDEKGHGKYCLASADGMVGGNVTREDVASFMVSLMTDTQHDGTAVSIGCELAPGEAGVAVVPRDGSEPSLAAADSSPLSALWGKVREKVVQGEVSGEGHSVTLERAASSCSSVTRISMEAAMEEDSSAMAADSSRVTAPARVNKVRYHARTPDVFFHEYR